MLSFIERPFNSRSHLLLHACPLTATPKASHLHMWSGVQPLLFKLGMLQPTVTRGSLVLPGNYCTPPLLLRNCRLPACLCLVLSYLRRAYFTLTPQGLKPSQVCHGCKSGPARSTVSCPVHLSSVFRCSMVLMVWLECCLSLPKLRLKFESQWNNIKTSNG